MEYYIEEYLNEVKEMKTKRRTYIENGKKKIDKLIEDNDFENAFSKLIYLFITIDNKEIPYILKYYDDVMKSKAREKMIFNKVQEISYNISDIRDNT